MDKLDTLYDFLEIYRVPRLYLIIYQRIGIDKNFRQNLCKNLQ